MGGGALLFFPLQALVNVNVNVNVNVIQWRKRASIVTPFSIKNDEKHTLLLDQIKNNNSVFVEYKAA